VKKMIWLTTVSVLFLVFVVPAILASALKMIPVNIQPGYNSDIRLSIYKIRGFSQKFVAKTGNLTAIGTSIRNPNLKNKTDVIFSLYDNGNLIRTSVLNGQNLEDGSFVKFVFPVIPDSLGKEYIFTITSPGAGPEETIEVFIISEPESTSGITEYIYEEEVHPGGIPLVSYSQPESKLKTINSVYSSWLSRLLSPGSQKSG